MLHGRRTAQLLNTLALILGLGGVTGLAMAAATLLPYDGGLDLVALPVLRHSVAWGLVLSCAALAVVVIAYQAGRQRVSRGFYRAMIAVGLAWLPACLAFGLWLNQRHLPRFLGQKSIVVNVVTSIVLIALLALLARAFERWWKRRILEAAQPSAWLVLVLAAALPILGLAERLSSRPDGPKIVVILVDVLRADHLGAYGYERDTSPNIDALAADAVVFEQTVAQSTFTKTSVASLFSGLYPHHHGVYIAADLKDPNDRPTTDKLRDELQTVAERLSDQGLVTAAWVENPQLQAHMGFDQGFDLFRDQPGPTKTIVREFRTWQRSVGRRQPFYAYLHIMDLHAPYFPKPPWDTKFGHYNDRFVDLDTKGWLEFRKGVRQGEIQPSQSDLDQLRALYDGQLGYVDSQIGRILADLKASRLYDQSMIVLIGDHGDAFMEHDFIFHSNTPYEELIRVPLIVKLPDSAHAGSRVKEPVALIDLSRTLLEFAGAPGGEALDGRNLLPLATAGANAPGTPVRAIISEYLDIIAVRAGTFKYIQHPDREPELYDLGSDPAERVDLAGLRPEIENRLEQVAAHVVASREALEDLEQVAIDEESLEKLEALGYLNP